MKMKTLQNLYCVFFVTREHSLPSAQTFVYVRNERQLSKETEVRTPGADNSIFNSIYIYSML